MIFTSICKKLERSARNGERMHLTPEESRAIIEHPAYAAILEAKTDEMIASWNGKRRVTEVPPAPAPSSDVPISTPAPAVALTVESDRARRRRTASVEPDREVVEAAVSQRVADVVAKGKRIRRRAFYDR